MAYIGVSPSNGVRTVFDYTATAGQTSFRGSDNNSQTLSYTDSAYIDVYQNGVLLIPSDYTATTGTSVVLDTGATVSDSVQIVVYDVFSVADTVSKANGGTFESNISIGGNLTVSGAFTSQGIDDNADATAITIGSDEVVDFASNADFIDGRGIRLGDGNDFQLYHDGTDNHINVTGSQTLNIQTSGNNAIVVDANVHVTKPLQPAFLVTKSATQTNMAVGGAAVTITFDTEVFDQNADFASNTFTAPVTGRYLFSIMLNSKQLDTSASAYNFRMASSNRNYSTDLTPTVLATDSGDYPIRATILADMDANDTISVNFVADGSQQVDVGTASFFSGFLVA